MVKLKNFLVSFNSFFEIILTIIFFGPQFTYFILCLLPLLTGGRCEQVNQQIVKKSLQATGLLLDSSSMKSHNLPQKYQITSPVTPSKQLQDMKRLSRNKTQNQEQYTGCPAMLLPFLVCAFLGFQGTQGQNVGHFLGAQSILISKLSLFNFDLKF